MHPWQPRRILLPPEPGKCRPHGIKRPGHGSEGIRSDLKVRRSLKPWSLLVYSDNLSHEAESLNWCRMHSLGRMQREAFRLEFVLSLVLNTQFCQGFNDDCRYYYYSHCQYYYYYFQESQSNPLSKSVHSQHIPSRQATTSSEAPSPELFLENHMGGFPTIEVIGSIYFGKLSLNPESSSPKL